MLIESPDKLVIRGRKLSWIDGTTFFAFKTPQGKIHIAITSGSGTEFLLQINQVDLTDYIKKNMPEVAVYLDHESLANVLHQLKPEMIKEKMNREEFEFSGRLWNAGERNYISFWNNKRSVDKSLLDKLLGYLKVNYQNTVFEFPTNQGDYKPYDEIMDNPTTAQKKSEDKFMSQIHTLPPGAKKWAMKGMSMREALFSESPDSIYPYETDFSEEVTFESDKVSSVFSIFKDQVTNRILLMTALCKNGNVYKITTGDKDIDAEIDVDKIKRDNLDSAMIHSNLLAPVAQRISDFGDRYEMRGFTRMSGRSFLVDGKTFISIWNHLSCFVKYKRQIDILINRLGVSSEDVLFEAVDFPGEYKTYKEVYGSTSEKKKSALSPEQIKDLMKKQHLDPRAKKILRKLASSDKHIDSLSRAANGMNVTVAQLRNMMTAGD